MGVDIKRHLQLHCVYSYLKFSEVVNPTTFKLGMFIGSLQVHEFVLFTCLLEERINPVELK